MVLLDEDDKQENRRLKCIIKLLESENCDSFVVMMLTIVIDL
jgi:hypothetical protein